MTQTSQQLDDLNQLITIEKDNQAEGVTIRGSLRVKGDLTTEGKYIGLETATEEKEGVVKFANPDDIDSGANFRVVSANHLKTTEETAKAYTDEQVGNISGGNYEAGEGINIQESTISVDQSWLHQKIRETLRNLGLEFPYRVTVPGMKPTSSDSRYGSFELGDYLYLTVNVGNERRLIRLQSGSLDEGFAGQGFFTLPVGLKFVVAQGKVFGFLFNRQSSRYEVYKLNLSGPVSVDKVATNDSLTSTGNGVHEVFAYGDKIYISLIDNGSPATGTGIMLFNAVTETIEVDIKVYDNGKQMYGVVQDSESNIWAVGSGTLLKLDAVLDIVEQYPLSHYLTGVYQYQANSILNYMDRDGATGVKVYMGDVDTFINDLKANGQLSQTVTLPLINALTGLSVYGAARLGQKVGVAYYITDNTTYEHYFALYDLATGQLDTSFNDGQPLSLDKSIYSSYWQRSYTHIIATNRELVYAYQPNASDMSLEIIM